MTRLKLTDSDCGIPEVVRSEEAAVGAMVFSITRMSEELASDKADNVGTDPDVEVVVVPGDRSGPRPLDRETTEAIVAADRRLGVKEAPMISVERALKEGKVAVSVDVATAGTMFSEVVPPRTDTTAGVDRVPMDSVDRDRAGCLLSVPGTRASVGGTHWEPRRYREGTFTSCVDGL